MTLRAGTLAVALLIGRAAWSQACPIPTDASGALGEIAPNARLAFLRDALRREAHAASTWRWTWTAVYSAATAAQFALTPALPTSNRGILYIDGTATALAVIPLQLFPLKVAHDGTAFDAQAQGAPPEETCALIREGEEILARDAANEAAMAGWVPQAAYFGYGTLISIIVGVASRQWLPALVSGLGAIIVGEGQILTQPTRLPDIWRSYRSGDLPVAPPAVSLNAIPTGVGFAGTF